MASEACRPKVFVSNMFGRCIILLYFGVKCRPSVGLGEALWRGGRLQGRASELELQGQTPAGRLLKPSISSAQEHAAVQQQAEALAGLAASDSYLRALQCPPALSLLSGGGRIERRPRGL